MDNCMKKKQWYERIPPEINTAMDKFAAGLLLVALFLRYDGLFQAIMLIAAAMNFYLVIHYLLRYFARRRRCMTIRFDKIQFPEVNNASSGLLAKDIVEAQPMTRPDVFTAVEKAVKVKVE